VYTNACCMCRRVWTTLTRFSPPLTVSWWHGATWGCKFLWCVGPCRATCASMLFGTMRIVQGQCCSILGALHATMQLADAACFVCRQACLRPTAPICACLTLLACAFKRGRLVPFNPQTSYPICSGIVCHRPSYQFVSPQKGITQLFHRLI